ncbi:TetR/AcrR family transcriptional regulator [Nocardioides panzhihuensis]|uniref:AcrR family transcriptional regulator n=1 Tax=Nocardioides panzhihuensis TaxID=860243 RepID=A0A7Z0DSJ5_9ACTN|nr:TetR/AcrR family transcriptional regulator [Nocardioides panzhihuensis]NYI80996.1 AcrR family transcriptional regulator [Nocardioides panzhihuensis]
MVEKSLREHTTGSRQMILEAALRLAAERGYVGTTMALVRRATGLPPSSLYWHFSNKDQLLAEALEHGYSSWRRVVPRWEPLPTGGDLRDGLLANLRRTTSDTHDAKTDWWRMGLMLALESGPTVGDGPRERFLRIRTQTLADFELWWSEAVGLPPAHTEILARLTLAAHDGLFIHTQTDAYAELDSLRRRLADGLAEVAIHLGKNPAATPVAMDLPPATYEAKSTSREKLVAAALEVAAESGYEGASISRICAAAGLPASSVYWHFANKDDLFSAAVDDSYRAWSRTQSSRQAPSPGIDWATELPRMLTPLVASLRRLPPFLRIGLMLVLPKRPEPLPGRDRFLAVRRQSREDFAGWFRGALGDDGAEHADEMAVLLLVIADGLLFAEALESADMPPVTTSDLLARLIAATPFPTQISH